MHASDLENARYNMVEQQVRPCEIIDERVLETLRTVPRENFVPEQYQGLAFADIHVPLADGSVMMKPMQEGFMLQALNIQKGERVLEIGTGSGFITACLVKLGGNVTSYEIDEEISKQAAERLHQQGIDGVTLVTGDIFDADLAEGSFDVIAVTGSLPTISEKLESLLVLGGRMFVIKGSEPAMCASIISRDGSGQLAKQKLCETVIPPLQNAPQAEGFTF